MWPVFQKTYPYFEPSLCQTFKLSILIARRINHRTPIGQDPIVPEAIQVAIKASPGPKQHHPQTKRYDRRRKLRTIRVQLDPTQRSQYPGSLIVNKRSEKKEKQQYNRIG